MQLWLTAASSTADAGIHEKILGSGTIRLMISNEEMEGIIKIIKFLENSELLVKGVRETIQKEAKVQKGGFFSVLLGTLDGSYEIC